MLYVLDSNIFPILVQNFITWSEALCQKKIFAQCSYAFFGFYILNLGNLIYIFMSVIKEYESFIFQVTYHFFHWKKGTPFAEDQGIYNRLTWWEQIDNGQQLTRNRKFLTVVPLVL